MRCLRCQHANDATARFCEECGARLSDYTCVACGAELRASTRFCPSCGTQVGSTADRAPAPDPRAYTPQHLAAKILQSKAALEGERKQVTVLFAPNGDLLTANADPAVSQDQSVPSEIVEFTRSGHFVREHSVDPNLGSAFALGIEGSEGSVVFAYVDDFLSNCTILNLSGSAF